MEDKKVLQIGDGIEFVDDDVPAEEAVAQLTDADIPTIELSRTTKYAKMLAKMPRTKVLAMLDQQYHMIVMLGNELSLRALEVFNAHPDPMIRAAALDKIRSIQDLTVRALEHRDKLNAVVALPPNAQLPAGSQVGVATMDPTQWESQFALAPGINVKPADDAKPN